MCQFTALVTRYSLQGQGGTQGTALHCHFVGIAEYPSLCNISMAVTEEYVYISVTVRHHLQTVIEIPSST